MATVPPTTPKIDLSSLNTVEEISKAFKQIVIEANVLEGVQSGLINQYDAIVNKAKKIKDETEKTVALQELQKIAAKNVSDLNTLGSLASQVEVFHKAKVLAIATNASKEIQDSLNQQYIQHQAQYEILSKNLNIEGEILKIEGEDLVLNTDITDEIKRRLIESEKLEEHLRKQKENSEKTKAAFIQIGKELTGIGPEMFTFTGLLSLMIQQFGAIENAAFAVRQHMGLLIRDVGEDGLYGIVQNVSNELSHIGVTAEIVGKSIISISSAFGSAAFVSADIVRNFSALEASLGISGDTSAKVLRTLMGISQSSAKSQVSMIGFAQAFSTAAGVPLADVMKDLSTLSDSVRQTFRGSTLQLVKSTVEARKLGLTITEVGNVAEKLLNFTDSINAEIEASVMLGKNISFQDARTLAYKGDILGATKNILDTIEQTTDLNKLDSLQLKSISEATGLTVGQLQDSLQIRKDVHELELSGNEEARKQVDLYNQLNGLGKYAAEMKGDDALKRIKETNNLARQKQIQAELLGLLNQVTEILMPIFKLVGYIAEGINFLNKISGGWLGTLTAGLVIGTLLIWGMVAAFKALSISIITGVFESLAVVIPALTTSLISMSTALTAASPVVGPATGVLIGLGLAFLGVGAGVYLFAKSLEITINALNNLQSIDFGNILKLAGAIGLLSVAMGASLIGGIFGSLGMTLMIEQLKRLQKVVDPLASSMITLSDSFSKLVNLMNNDGLSLGMTASKNGIKELREEIQKFNAADLKTLETLRATNTTGTEVTNKKESGYADLTNAIVNAIQNGMSRIQITVNPKGEIATNFTMGSQPVRKIGNA